MQRLSLVCLMAALVATLHASVLHQRPQAVGGADDGEAFYFVADGRKRPYAFINDDGSLVGFDVDLVDAVCKIAGKKCFSILQEYQECIFTDRNIDYAGNGLQSGWFDGCPGYAITTDRLNNFDFTLPYLETRCTFATVKGNPKKFDPLADDYSDFTLLHLSGAASNSACLTRLGKGFDKILIADTLAEAKEMLANGTADALFSPRRYIHGLETLDHRFRCSQQGAGIMLRKGSNIPSWWNPAFQEFYFSGEFEKLCDASADKYGSAARCIAGPNQADPELLAFMTRPMPATPNPERLWKFVVSGRVAPYSYLNKEGELVGFTRNMLMEVCARAGKRCALMTAQVPECTTRVGEYLYPGRGIQENWFDGCTGYFNTYERSNSWDFTGPYLVSASDFRVAPGNPKKFNPQASDYSPWTLVRGDTAITNDHCLHRLHKKWGKLLVAKDVIEAQEMVLNGTADAWFTKYHGDDVKLEVLPGKFHCGHVGTSIMTRKGQGVNDWWNPAFEHWYKTGGFNDFCKAQEKVYNVKFPCLPRPKIDDLAASTPLSKHRTVEEGF